MELIRYIHLNPVRAKLVQDLKELDKYLWTGHSAILGRCKNLLIPNLPDQSKVRNTREEPNKQNKPNEPDQPTKFLAEKTIEDVLLYFGVKLGEARRRYRQFVKNGVDQGTRPDLQGGGLVRSAGENKSGLLGRKKEEREKGDERILGSGDFVTGILKKAGESFEMQSEEKLSLDLIIDTVTKHIGVTVEDLNHQVEKARLCMLDLL